MANKPKEYGVAPDSPRTQGSVTRRIEELGDATRRRGLDIYSFLRLRRLGQKIDNGEYHEDRFH